MTYNKEDIIILVLEDDGYQKCLEIEVKEV